MKSKVLLSWIGAPTMSKSKWKWAIGYKGYYKIYYDGRFELVDVNYYVIDRIIKRITRTDVTNDL